MNSYNGTDELISWIRNNINEEEARNIAIDVVIGYRISSKDIEKSYLREKGIP
jgi:hypothetical protein